MNEDLINKIKTVIKENNNQEITGQSLQDLLIEIVQTLGAQSATSPFFVDFDALYEDDVDLKECENIRDAILQNRPIFHVGNGFNATHIVPLDAKYDNSEHPILYIQRLDFSAMSDELGLYAEYVELNWTEGSSDVSRIVRSATAKLNMSGDGGVANMGEALPLYFDTSNSERELTAEQKAANVKVYNYIMQFKQADPANRKLSLIYANNLDDNNSKLLEYAVATASWEARSGTWVRFYADEQSPSEWEANEKVKVYDVRVDYDGSVRVQTRVAISIDYETGTQPYGTVVWNGMETVEVATK